MEAILRANGVAPGPLHCANPSYDGAVTRAVACTTRLSAADLAALRSGVPLQPGKAAPYGHQDSCEATPGFGSTGPDLEVLVGKNTKVPNGVGTLELHVARGTGEACIEIHYPWSS